MYPPTSSPVNASPSSISESETETSLSSKFSVTTLENKTQHSLLAPEAVPAIVSLFDLDLGANDGLNRAIEHARLTVASGRDDL